jgi:hypothetical protein
MALPSILYDDGGRDRVVFTLPEATNTEVNSVLAFAMPKSGSVLLDRILRDLTPQVGLTYVSIMEEFFNLGIPDNLVPPSTAGIFLPKGYCYGGFRYFPRKFEIPIVPKVKKILLIRDPRDMLVSHYYSMLKSHPERGKLVAGDNRMKSRDLANELDIDSYVRRMAKRFNIFLQNYRLLCEKEDVRQYRYEDVIYEKPAWIANMCSYFGWAIPTAVIEEIAKRHDIIPMAEDDNQHIRQVHPGNYKKKLASDTITELTDYFSDTLDFYGYSKNER